MKYLLALLLFAAITVTFGQTSSPDTATWTWTAPTAYTDGTPIPSTVTLTYNIYIGTAGKGSEPAAATQTGITGSSLTTSGYAAGETVCGEITAVAGGEESARSNETCKTFLAIPSAPTGLSVK